MSDPRWRAPSEAIVTDVGLRNVVAGLRALGRAEVPLIAVARERNAAGMRSRYASERVVLASATDDASLFAKAIDALATARAEGSDRPFVVYPGAEEAIDALLRREPEADSWCLPWPVRSTQLLRDKEALAGLCDSAGVAVPRSLATGTPDELLASLPETPCIVKPVGGGGGRAVAARDADGLREVLSGWPDPGERLVAQERADGDLVSLGLVLDDRGGVAAAFQQRALETWPPEAGTVSYAVGETVRENLLDSARRLLEAAGHVGFAQVQFLAGRKMAWVIDVNCGFPGSLPLALASGVNLPLAAHRIARGEAVPAVRPYRPGKRYRWLEADIMASARGRPRALLRRPGGAGAVWARDDPMPSAILAWESVAGRARRLARPSP